MICLSCTVPQGTLSGQDEHVIPHQIDEIMTKTADYYGPDEVLENGRFYSPAHPKAEGDPFFLGPVWMQGSIIIEGDHYQDQILNYDVSVDQLILKKESENRASHYPIALNSNFIESFVVNDRHFINLDKTPIGNELSGYAELIYQGEFTFIAKYSKEFLNQYNQSNPYGYYSRLATNYYIYEKDALTRLGTRNAFLEYFKSQRKKLKRYMRQHHIRYMKAAPVELFDLMHYADELSEK